MYVSWGKIELAHLKNDRSFVQTIEQLDCRTKKRTKEKVFFYLFKIVSASSTLHLIAHIHILSSLHTLNQAELWRLWIVWSMSVSHAQTSNWALVIPFLISRCCCCCSSRIIATVYRSRPCYTNTFFVLCSQWMSCWNERWRRACSIASLLLLMTVAYLFYFILFYFKVAILSQCIWMMSE